MGIASFVEVSGGVATRHAAELTKRTSRQKTATRLENIRGIDLVSVNLHSPA